jgi:hypothetical protein
VWIATPSLYETFIHNTLPAFTGASERLERLEPALFDEHQGITNSAREKKE